MLVLSIAVFSAVLLLGDAQPSTSQNTMIQQLYETIRAVALPNAGAASTKRLVLIIPGKFLYERDYYPGAAYVNFVSNPNQGTFQQIPPIKEQNLFRLVDVIPGIDPLQGAESGESFSVIYNYILGQMDIVGFDQLTSESKVRTTESTTFLRTVVTDPSDATRQLTRWELYRRYENLYQEERARLEEEIEIQRTTRSSIDYQIWFQRQYPQLQAQVDGAYMDWIVNGDKELVELYRARLDATSIANELLEAKAAVRASGVPSLDRSTTIYPVDFTPSNWYTYLKDPTLGMDGEQAAIKIGELQSRITFLEAIRDYDVASNCPSLVTEINTMESSFNTSRDMVSSGANSLMGQRCECIIERYTGGADSECSDLDSSSDSSTANLEDASAKFQVLSALRAARDGDEDAINELIADVQGQLDSITAELRGRGYGVPDAALSAGFSITEPPEAWLSFSFSTATASTVRSSYRSSYSATDRVRSFGWVQRSSTTSISSSVSSAYSAISNSAFSVSGEILRVTVKYPWFRASLFRSTKLKLRSETTQVSPGLPDNADDDRDFVDAVVDGTYLLPQYVTGLLLARNVTLRFQVSSSVASSFVSESNVRSASASYGPFCMSARYRTSSRTTSQSSFRASTSSSGLNINIPGTQQIGYYTEVVPRFPNIDG